MLIEQEIPETLKNHIIEPKVTEQILDLNITTMSIYEKKMTTVTRSAALDQLNCVVTGQQTWYVVSGWEYSKMRVG